MNKLQYLVRLFAILTVIVHTKDVGLLEGTPKSPLESAASANMFL